MRKAEVCLITGCEEQGVTSVRWCGVQLALLLLLSQTVLAEVTRFRGGVRNSPDKQQLAPKQLKEVLKSLRAKTGWEQLDFDGEGFLVCPAPEFFKGGSEAARKLLAAALASAEAFDLEVFNHSTEVAFARLAASIQYESRRTGSRISAHPLQIDLSDFAQLRGDTDAVKAFDLGLVILHELAHGVWRLRDAASLAEEPGECESYINKIRRELNLPERLQYLARVRSGGINFSNGNVLIAELGFARRSTKGGLPKHQQYYLQWEAQLVGAVRIKGWDQKPEVLATYQ